MHYRVRWKHKTEMFPSKEAAIAWARKHEGARVAYWTGMKWEEVKF